MRSLHRLEFVGFICAIVSGCGSDTGGRRIVASFDDGGSQSIGPDRGATQASGTASAEDSRLVGTFLVAYSGVTGVCDASFGNMLSSNLRFTLDGVPITDPFGGEEVGTFAASEVAPGSVELTVSHGWSGCLASFYSEQQQVEVGRRYVVLTWGRGYLVSETAKVIDVTDEYLGGLDQILLVNMSSVDATFDLRHAGGAPPLQAVVFSTEFGVATETQFDRYELSVTTFDGDTVVASVPAPPADEPGRGFLRTCFLRDTNDGLEAQCSWWGTSGDAASAPQDAGTGASGTSGAANLSEPDPICVHGVEVYCACDGIFGPGCDTQRANDLLVHCYAGPAVMNAQRDYFVCLEERLGYQITGNMCAEADLACGTP